MIRALRDAVLRGDGDRQHIRADGEQARIDAALHSRHRIRTRRRRGDDHALHVIRNGCGVVECAANKRRRQRTGAQHQVRQVRVGRRREHQLRAELHRRVAQAELAAAAVAPAKHPASGAKRTTVEPAGARALRSGGEICSRYW